MSSGTTAPTDTADRHDEFVALALRLREQGAVEVADGGLRVRWSSPPEAEQPDPAAEEVRKLTIAERERLEFLEEEVRRAEEVP